MALFWVMDPLLLQLREDLTDRIDPVNQEGAKRFFKEAIESYGIRMADTRLIAKEYFKELKGRSKPQVFELCEELWRSGLMEEAHIAAFWCYALRKEFSDKDIDTFERWIGTYIGNWANCDNFCNNVMGAYFERFPAQTKRLANWARSGNRWLRRASTVSLIVPARKGKFLSESFEAAQRLFGDTDDLVLKGYGWLLKEQCKKHEAAVFEFLMEHKDRMPRLAVRYAAEKMAANHKQELFAKASG